MSCLFLGNNRQHIPLCAKIVFFFLCIRKVLGIAKVYMSPGSFQGAAVSIAFAPDVNPADE